MQNMPNRRILAETLAIIGFLAIFSFLMPQLRGLFQLVPIAYFFIERHLRQRSFEEIGFKFRQTFKGIKNNWHFIFLVAIVSPFATLFIANILVPDFVSHVQSRIPMLSINQLIPLLIMITIGTFAEEVVFRGFFQERLRWYFGTVVAILVPSILFAIMHFSAGSFSVVSYDLFTIFIDSLIYGVIYHRTKNIFVSWFAHYLADIFGVVAILLLFQ